MKNFFSVVCCVCAILLTSGCVFSSREVTVSRNDSLHQRREYFRNELINHDGLALESENFLRGNLMRNDLKSEPLTVLNSLNEFYRISGNPKFLVIAADLCRYLATQTDETDSIRCSLSSFYYCTQYARAVIKTNYTTQNHFIGNFAETQSLQAYNEACCGIFSFLKKRNLLDAGEITLHDLEGRPFTIAKPIFNLSVPRESVEDFSLCASYTVKDLMQMNRRPGSGVPLVAKIKMKQCYSSLRTPKGLTIPVTLMMRREETGADNRNILRLIFNDTTIQEEIQMNVKNIFRFNTPMSLDFSTPLAVFLNENTQRNLLFQMLNPFEQESSDGLYMIEPYHPDKIPVVFIHGLMFSPETWMQMINSLKNDPTIRKRYQFWFFSYSTGSPVMLSAKKLRNALLAAQKEFCTTPEATANFNQMVLIGHSMGGMLTRLMVQKDPHFIPEDIVRLSWDQIKEKLQPEDFKWVESFVPYSLPFVHRVIFMAVPHKGANMAQSPIARLGANIIRHPASLLNRGTTLRRVYTTLHSEKYLFSNGRFLTGIDNLDPKNAFVLALGKSPLKEDLTYHCIIGNNREDDVPGDSDGVVPYWSSHLDGAASELVVKSSHSVHRKPKAIQEVLRILLLHVKEPDKK